MPEKTDEGIKSVSADKINEFFESGGKKLKVKSDNEKLKEITDLKPKAGFMTILYRQMRLNMDLVLLFTIILCFTCFGYCLAFVTLAFSTDQIKVGIRTFFEIFGSLVAGAIIAIWKMYTPPGKIAQSLCRIGNKKCEDVDSWGHTIVSK